MYVFSSPFSLVKRFPPAKFSFCKACGAGGLLSVLKDLEEKEHEEDHKRKKRAKEICCTVSFFSPSVYLRSSGVFSALKEAGGLEEGLR